MTSFPDRLRPVDRERRLIAHADRLLDNSKDFFSGGFVDPETKEVFPKRLLRAKIYDFGNNLLGRQIPPIVLIGANNLIPLISTYCGSNYFVSNFLIFKNRGRIRSMQYSPNHFSTSNGYVNSAGLNFGYEEKPFPIILAYNNQTRLVEQRKLDKETMVRSGIEVKAVVLFLELEGRVLTVNREINANGFVEIGKI